GDTRVFVDEGQRSFGPRRLRVRVEASELCADRLYVFRAQIRDESQLDAVAVATVVQLDTVDLARVGQWLRARLPYVVDELCARSDTGETCILIADATDSNAIDAIHLQDTDRMTAIAAAHAHVGLVPTSEGERHVAADETLVKAFLEQEHGQ